MLISDCLHYKDIDIENKLCLIHGDVKYTYQEFAQSVEHLACRLALKIKKGDKVLLNRTSPVDQLLYFFAAIKAGGSCILIDPSASEEFISGLISRHHISIYIDQDFQPSDMASEVLPDIMPQDLFLGALSSGSTGESKVIWRDHTSWVSAFGEQSKVFQISESDTLFLVGSLVYTANLNACLHMLFSGGTVVIASNRRPRTWIREMTSYQVSAIFMVPANYKVLLKNMTAPFSQVKSIVSCGAKIDRNTVEQLIKRFPSARVIEYYGASELGHVSYMTADDLLKKPESVGRPFPGVKVWIDGGTIWTESPYLAPAYKPRATVGDLGKFDAEGYLYLIGRKHGIINSGGVKVVPEQVESVLQECPGVYQAAVGGIADQLKGQRVCAWIVRDDPMLKASDVLAFCRTKLRRSCCPQKIVFIESMPVNTSGKIDRSRLSIPK